MRVLISGATGSLGRAILAAPAAADLQIRAQSRRVRPQNTPSAIEWARADLATGKGLAEAMLGVDAIIHAASDPRRAEPLEPEVRRQLHGDDHDDERDDRPVQEDRHGLSERL